MNSIKTNLSALNFSPHFWWKTIERSILFTESFGKDLYPQMDFREWLSGAIIEHPSLDIYNEELNGAIHNPEYGRMVSNDYYYEVIATSRYGHKVKARTPELLHTNPVVSEGTALSYSFKIDELQHLATLHFMNWLLLGTHFHWVRWQLYFDFIASKVDEPLKGLYYYMWSIIMGEVNFHDKFFEEVNQYKLFRDKYDEIGKAADIVQDKFVKLRSSGKAVKKSQKRG